MRGLDGIFKLDVIIHVRLILLIFFFLYYVFFKVAGMTIFLTIIIHVRLYFFLQWQEWLYFILSWVSSPHFHPHQKWKAPPLTLSPCIVLLKRKKKKKIDFTYPHKLSRTFSNFVMFLTKSTAQFTISSSVRIFH